MQRTDGALSPTHVEAKCHDPIDHVVSGCDCIEHVANRSNLCLANRKIGGIPGIPVVIGRRIAHD
ncbi:unannotated protein [freshwater metagenome]|uniref:Unannotated protein n=1 Tax=freshwater metagenome TaxID=449393 RepID=A0A6J7N3A2_9ZZZZ